MAKQIPLTKGFTLLIDESDFDLLSRFKWCATRYGDRYYARAWNPATKKVVYAHRLILNAPVGSSVDHISGDGLDCRRENLRLCSTTQNNWNARLASSNTSGFKGVVFHKHIRKFGAKISVSNRTRNLGVFTSPEEAARCYDENALKLRGEFAKTNVMLGLLPPLPHGL